MGGEKAVTRNERDGKSTDNQSIRRCTTADHAEHTTGDHSSLCRSPSEAGEQRNGQADKELSRPKALEQCSQEHVKHDIGYEDIRDEAEYPIHRGINVADNLVVLKAAMPE